MLIYPSACLCCMSNRALPSLSGSLSEEKPQERLLSSVLSVAPLLLLLSTLFHTSPQLQWVTRRHHVRSDCTVCCYRRLRIRCGCCTTNNTNISPPLCSAGLVIARVDLRRQTLARLLRAGKCAHLLPLPPELYSDSTSI